MSAQSTFLSLGLMSGTSADGIDAALVRTDGENIVECLEGVTVPYSFSFSQRLLQACRSHVPDSGLEQQITLMHRAAVDSLLVTARKKMDDVHVIGFHGHTIHHAPEKGETVQLGDGALLARLTGVPVINNFRQNDVRHGGQGAPLVPVFHRALARNLPKPLAIVNIGGVANVTWIGRDSELLAFDTGPGNALLNDWLQLKCSLPFDTDGAVAASGSVLSHLLKEWLEHPWLLQSPPKSLDRNAFAGHLPILEMENVRPEDGAATLTAFTAQGIINSRRFFPEAPVQWIVAGGGASNPVLMEHLQEAAGDVPVSSGSRLGFHNDLLEAQAFAYLAVRSWRGLPITFPETTGVSMPLPGGVLHERQRLAMF